MISNKKTGSYYTPIKTVRFMYKYLESQKNWVCDMLEPSAGDGRFIEQGLKNDTISKIVGVELKTRQKYFYSVLWVKIFI